ncbi:MAG TPA: phosphoglycerate kinase [Acidimicrobiales bacterium]|nr:phosphoglycerate kinase [Acidimicrobiales bacterium]
MTSVPQLEDLPDVSGRSVLLRADFNVPITNGVIDDDLRIRAALPTINWLLERGAKVTACSHLGRPKGKRDPKYSMEPVRARLDELVGSGKIELLENLRYDAGEEGNDPAFVEKLVAGHDVYVNDAFGAAHRAHASIVGPPKTLPSAAGRLLAKEVEVLGGLLADPARPFVAILGGSKVSDKLGVIEALLQKVDKILIGGGMCFTFLKAEGYPVGDSLLEQDQVETCKRLLETGKIQIPEDVVQLSPDGEIGKPDTGTARTGSVRVQDGWKGLDIGPGTAAAFGDVIAEARTIFWNGPMGVFEDPRFEAGTKAVAHACAEARGFTIVGGGDSAAALAKFGLDDDIDHVSTGGGASLEFLEQGDLPGLEALRNAPNAR